MHNLLINLISLLGLFGFILSFYIFSKKKSKKKMICPMKSDCDTVIHSDYSKILGVRVEILGMLYYFFIGFVYSASYVFGFWSTPLSIFLFGLSLCAILFSIYLVSLQAFVLRHWCTWCLLSAAISFLIGLISYIHLFVAR